MSPVQIEEVIATPRPGRRMWNRLRRDKVSLGAMVVLGAIVLIALLAPWISADPYAGSALARLKPIGTPGHWLGTDEIGRDMWARLAHGARLSLLSGTLPVAVALLIGGGLGVIAGYAGGLVNTLIMRTMDVFYAFPAVLLAIAVCAVIGTGIASTLIALTIVFIPSLVRVTETVTTRIRSMDYVEAARASGVADFRIIIHQVLPNIVGTILVYAAGLASLSIILAAGLSFLGLGMPPPNAEWGQMLNSLRQSIYIQPWLSALPGVMIFITSVSFNLISDGLRSAIDVKDNG
ncbi:MAG: ABC transporter permease [Hyphomicrobiales bacterium]|nr:MAG: ABC transporter permease [Hyphomicrobiales bacterium]